MITQSRWNFRCAQNLGRSVFHYSRSFRSRCKTDSPSGSIEEKDFRLRIRQANRREKRKTSQWTNKQKIDRWFIRQKIKLRKSMLDLLSTGKLCSLAFSRFSNSLTDITENFISIFFRRIT